MTKELAQRLHRVPAQPLRPPSAAAVPGRRVSQQQGAACPTLLQYRLCFAIHGIPGSLTDTAN
jgi:hypothetical protein